jgi:hypothetical protein
MGTMIDSDRLVTAFEELRQRQFEARKFAPLSMTVRPFGLEVQGTRYGGALVSCYVIGWTELAARHHVQHLIGRAVDRVLADLRNGAIPASYHRTSR